MASIVAAAEYEDDLQNDLIGLIETLEHLDAKEKGRGSISFTRAAHAQPHSVLDTLEGHACVQIDAVAIIS